MRHLKTLLTTGFVWLVMNQALFAKGSKIKAAAKEPGYGLAWALVAMFVILGLAIAIRPAKRKTEFKKTTES